VLLDELELQALDDGTLVYTFDMVPGDGDNPTPKGCFYINRKHETYTSKKYKVPMNYAMFFKDTGEAIHQYHGPVSISTLKAMRAVSDFFGSHGCVRLDEADAKKLFTWAPMGTPVQVGTKDSIPTCPVRPRRKKNKKKAARR
jgi:hypothetical protein